MDIRPAVYHMNEGHAAFLTLERTSLLVKGAGLPFEAAREYIAATTLFTTHTPVPAGHDRFGEDLVRRYFGDAEEWVGLPWESFFALGQASGGADDFNMTYLAMNFAGFVNGVSKMHGTASQKLLHAFWPGLLESERSGQRGSRKPASTTPPERRWWVAVPSGAALKSPATTTAASSGGIWRRARSFRRRSRASKIWRNRRCGCGAATK